MSELAYIIYNSTAVELMSSAQLIELLATARRNNLRDGITGMLLYRNGSFLQVIEGERSMLDRLWMRLVGDARHRLLIKLDEGRLERREFSKWTMGFHDTRDLPPSEWPGYTRFLRDPFDPAEFDGSPGRALTMLKSFRDWQPPALS